MLSGDTTQLTSQRVGLRPKLVLAFVLQTIVIALLIVGLGQWRVRDMVREQLLARADGLARTVAVASDNAAKNGRIGELRAVAGDVKSRAWVDYADFVTADGRIVAASSGAPPSGLTTTAGRSDLRAANGEALH